MNGIDKTKSPSQECHKFPPNDETFWYQNLCKEGEKDKQQCKGREEVNKEKDASTGKECVKRSSMMKRRIYIFQKIYLFIFRGVR